MSKKVCICLVVPVVLVGSALFLLMATSRLDDKKLLIFRQKPLKTAYPATTALPRHRYSTSDEMRYILYGVGGQFSPYVQQLIHYIRSRISTPSLTRPRQISAGLIQKGDASQAGQSAFIDKFLSGRENGFFIECGAADGVTISNSLFFELKRNWTGLLIEANPGYHRELLDKNRHAYVLHACLSTERRPATVRVQPADLLGGIADKMHPLPLTSSVTVRNRKSQSTASH